MPRCERRGRSRRDGARARAAVRGTGIAVVMLALMVLLALALPRSVVAEEPLSPEALEIANELNCPVCEGQSVRDSNSQLARQMRQVIQQKLDAGESPEQIKSYFVERYGIGILREPPKQGFTWALWWGPIVGLVFGGAVLYAYLSRRASAAERQAADLDTEELRRVEERLLSEAE